MEQTYLVYFIHRRRLLGSTTTIDVL